MSDYSVFDIAGPIMIGPSSSHTAGAAKIGLIARSIFGKQPAKVTLFLHGSFAQVYAGHATDRALISGLLGFAPDDTRLRNAFDIAKEQGMEYEFKTKNLGKEYHANTVKIVMQTGDEEATIIGSSIGGGVVEIKQIDSFPLKLTSSQARLCCLVIWHQHTADLIDSIVEYLSKNHKKIHHQIASRDPQNIALSLTIMVLSQSLSEAELEEIAKKTGITKVVKLQDLPV